MDFNEWANKKRMEFSQGQTTEQIEMGAAKELITRKTVRFVSDDFAFETNSKILPKHYRALSKLQSMVSDGRNLDNYDVLQNEMAEFMAQIAKNK